VQEDGSLRRLAIYPSDDSEDEIRTVLALRAIRKV
jgi:hypothetical protein